MTQDIKYIILEEVLKILDFALRLKYYYLVLSDCFSLLPYFVTFLTKLILWLKFTHRKRQVEAMVSKDLLCFIVAHLIIKGLICMTRPLVVILIPCFHH